MLKIVVGLAGLFEGIGIVLLLFAFVPQFGLEGIWVSVFTAISAFCNAGFDLFGRFGQYSSLAPYVNNYYVQAVVMFMIISGGLGFMVWVEIGQYRKKHRLSLQAKVVLSFSVILWLGGAALIPFTGFVWPEGEEWLWVLGLSVTAITAQMAFTWGCQHVHSVIISFVMYTAILFHILAGWLFWGEVLTVWSWIGGAAIVGGSALLLWRTR